MIRQCFDCRLQLASGLQPEIAPLPTLRFSKDKPFLFQQTGLQQQRQPDAIPNNLQAQDIRQAKDFVLKQSQLECFQDEILRLQQERPIKANSRLRQLAPFLDNDGFIRAQ